MTFCCFLACFKDIFDSCILFPEKSRGETARSDRPELFYKKGVRRNFTKFTEKHLCQSLFFIKKETLAQVFFCGFCEISKETFLHRTLLVAASGKHYLFGFDAIQFFFSAYRNTRTRDPTRTLAGP